jgi:uncharacterized protein YbaR (Trm112 family)
MARSCRQRALPGPAANGGFRLEEDNAVLDPKLLEILACPACHGTLKQEGNELICESCGRHYPIRDGIPVLLVDAPEEAEAATDGTTAGEAAVVAEAGKAGLLSTRLVIGAALVLAVIAVFLFLRRRTS